MSVSQVEVNVSKKLGTSCSDSFPRGTNPYLRKSSFGVTKFFPSTGLNSGDNCNFQYGIVRTAFANCRCYNRNELMSALRAPACIAYWPYNMRPTRTHERTCPRLASQYSMAPSGLVIISEFSFCSNAKPREFTAQ